MPTPNYGLPTIDLSNTANVPRDMNALAMAVDSAIKSATEGVDLSSVNQRITNVENTLNQHVNDYEVLNQEFQIYKNDVNVIKTEINGVRTRLINLANSIVDEL